MSIVCTGRNDDRAPDQFERLVSVQRTLAHALRKVPFEFIFVEWNPDPDRSLLGEALFLEQARHYVVTREAHKQLVADARLSTRDGKAVKGERAFLLNHANNVGLKHSRGDWVLITNLDDLFPFELGQFFESGESGALARGRHPVWSYNLLIRLRRAQRTRPWRIARSLPGLPRTVLVWSVSTSRLVKRTLRLTLRRFGRRFRPVRYVLGVTSRGVAAAIRGAARPFAFAATRAWLRVHALAVRLLGGGSDKTKKGPSALGSLLRIMVGAPRAIGRVVGGAALFFVMPFREPRVFAWYMRRVLRRVRSMLRPIRRRTRKIAKPIYDFFFAARVDWNVGRVALTPGTLYRVRRQHVGGGLARVGASDMPTDAFVHLVEAEAVPGPWNNHFPWTWACGDFLLMDRKTWERIGGFPQQIGQLHADSVTIFRIVSEGSPVVLLDWNIYHMDHDDRFDTVPYVEYDFENVRQYFLPGWSRAAANLIIRDQRTSTQLTTSTPKRVLVGTAVADVQSREEQQ